MNKIETDNIDIHSWCPDIEDEAMEQMKFISSLPYVRHCALMPDAHLGMDMPIGGVVATENVIVPNMVGADIGCGMCAMKSNLNVDELTKDRSKYLFDRIRELVPVGFARHSDKTQSFLSAQYKDEYDKVHDSTLSQNDKSFRPPHYPLIVHDSEAFFAQLGTLGGGNHFLEIQADEDGSVWAMVHSGSRNIGKRVGEFYNEIANKLNETWHSKNGNIPFLPTDTTEGKAYLTWMDYSLQFAFLNRKAMMDRVQEAFAEIMPHTEWITEEIVEDTHDGLINIHHNFAAIENHMGRNVWVHRKGATKASKGLTGIIPGSMGTPSYITVGKGSVASLMSCSHGAGRRMGRMEYSRQMKNKRDEINASLKNIMHTDFGEFKYGKNKGLPDVSEAPGAYKDIEHVMNNQKDLVGALVKLRPLISIKG